MILDKLIRKILKGHPEDDLVVCNSQEYYNSENEIKYDEVIDVIRENGKLIILTR